ncbi:MAG: type II secretion system F family protein [Candidatus Aenigmarchaeota archaeon]|nr:type II secretion system F family protein [Candidatus Aenigmarchaeota archaeon]
MESKHIFITSSIAFVFIIIAAIFVNNFVIASNLIFLGAVILIFPYSLNKFFEFKRTRAYEEEFPNFLRDLAESQRAGLTLMQALQSASKTEYGMLTYEIKRMYNQLTWNVPVETVLKNFSERIKKSKMIVRAMMIIDQATKSGGNVEQTMESLATNIESLREVQEEKSLMLNQQVIMMYAIFFIFLGISIALIKFLVPLFQTQTEAGSLGFQGFGANPCVQCIGNSAPVCLGCHTFFAVSEAFNFGKNEDAISYYKALFFTMIMVQGFFSGLIAGQIGSDSIIGGVKHSMIMLIAGFFIFMLSIRIGFI